MFAVAVEYQYDGSDKQLLALRVKRARGNVRVATLFAGIPSTKTYEKGGVVHIHVDGREKSVNLIPVALPPEDARHSGPSSGSDSVLHKVTP